MKDNIQYIIIDLFCGAGGTTYGFENAVDDNGQKIAIVAVGVNHDPIAIESHAANHPETVHFKEDIRSLDLNKVKLIVEKKKELYPSASLLIHASLECTNHSNAKGGLPRNRDSRMLAYELNRYVEYFGPDFITIENVREFLAWGEIDSYGKPISRDNGKYFQNWTFGLCRKFNYRVEWRILNAADYGAYTSRKRLFMVFAKPEHSISFPHPTHAKNPKNGMFGKLQKWKAVKEVLDLKDEGKSIFNRKKSYSERTLKRILAGLVKFVANGDKKWMVKYLSNNARTGINVGVSLCSPSPTVTTQGRLALASVIFLQSNYSGDPFHKVQNINKPGPTVTTIPHESLVNVNFIKKYYGNGDNISSVDEPSGTITTKDRMAKVTCTISIKDSFIVNPQYNSKGHSIDVPSPVLIARMDKKPLSLLTAKSGTLLIPIYEDDNSTMQEIKTFMAVYGICDIKMRMLKIIELKRIQGFPDSYALLGNKTQQKKFIGNAVECGMGKVLLEALWKAN